MTLLLLALMAASTAAEPDYQVARSSVPEVIDDEAFAKLILGPWVGTDESGGIEIVAGPKVTARGEGILIVDSVWDQGALTWIEHLVFLDITFSCTTVRARTDRLQATCFHVRQGRRFEKELHRPGGLPKKEVKPPPSPRELYRWALNITTAEIDQGILEADQVPTGIEPRLLGASTCLNRPDGDETVEFHYRLVINKDGGVSAVLVDSENGPRTHCISTVLQKTLYPAVAGPTVARVVLAATRGPY